MTNPQNDPLDPTAPYPSAGNRSDAAPGVDVDPRSTEAADSGTADAERAEYSVDQVGDDQTPADRDPGDEQALVDSATAEPAADQPPVDPDNTPTSRTTPSTPSTQIDADEPLVPTDEGVDFKARWDVIQQGFVDDPRTAVTDADKLVGDVLDRLSTTFDEQHRTLEGQWSNGEPNTEDLRSALQRYRAFFERLLTI